MAEAVLALVFGYLWVGLLEAIDRFERPSPRPEYETAEPEFAAAPSFGRTLLVVLLFPVSNTIGRPLWRSALKVMSHAALVYCLALGLSLVLDRAMLGLAVIGLGVCVVAFFYILTSTTRLD